MFDLSILKQFSIGGKSFTHQQTLSKGGCELLEQLIPIAWTGTLTVRTDADTGTFTMADAAHLITTGAKIDIYWTNADGTIGSRRGVTVGTVATTSVPFGAGAAVGAGDNLPIATTVCQVAVVQTYTASITGSLAAAIVAAADYTRCTIALYSTGDTVEELAIVLPLSSAYDWLSTGGAANPITGDTIDKIHMSIADTVTPRNVRLAVLLTP